MKVAWNWVLSLGESGWWSANRHLLKIIVNKRPSRERWGKLFIYFLNAFWPKRKFCKIKNWVMVNHLYLFVELFIISTNMTVTLNDKKKKNPCFLWGFGVLCQWSLYPQTDLESENRPESLLRGWLTCITNLSQVCHHAQRYSHSDYRLWDPLLRGRKFTFYLNTFTTALEAGLNKHPHFTGERLGHLGKVTQPGSSWDWNSVFCPPAPVPFWQCSYLSRDTDCFVLTS